MKTPSTAGAAAIDASALPQLNLPSDWAARFDSADPRDECNERNEDNDGALTWLAPLVAVLPAYLARQRWFAAKGQGIDRLAIVRQRLWQQRWLLLQIDIDVRAGASQSYWLPLAILWDDRPDAATGEEPDAADVLARVCDYTRDNAHDGVLVDAFVDPAFAHALLAAMCQGTHIAGMHGTLEFSSTRACARLAGDDFHKLAVRRGGATSSNTALYFGDRLFLKAYRRLSVGVNPEVEMGRFLTDASPYAHIAPFAGALEYRRNDGSICALAMLQGYVASQGDAWSHTLEHLRALMRASLSTGASSDEAQRAAQARHWAMLGRRTGELHRALATTTGDPAFDPQPLGDDTLAQWIVQVGAEAAQTLAQLAAELEAEQQHLPTSLRAVAQRLLAARGAVLEHIASLRPRHFSAQITRYHGDYHLGQVLVADGDFVIIDFEGEPSRTLAERRSKHSPLRDVAGLLRSLNYAANSALGEALSTGHVSAAQQAAISAVLADWEARAKTAFLDAYRTTVRGCPAYPDDAQASAALLELFLIEKAFYELRYELSHRPDWVHVPLGGLTALFFAAAPVAPTDPKVCRTTR